MMISSMIMDLFINGSKLVKKLTSMPSPSIELSEQMVQCLCKRNLSPKQRIFIVMKQLMVIDLMINSLRMKMIQMMISLIITDLLTSLKFKEWVLINYKLKQAKLQNIRNITRNTIRNPKEVENSDIAMKLLMVMCLMTKSLKMKMIPEMRQLIIMALLTNGNLFIRAIIKIKSMLMLIIMLLCKRRL